jgi:hypothetical protein
MVSCVDRVGVQGFETLKDLIHGMAWAWVVPCFVNVGLETLRPLLGAHLIVFEESREMLGETVKVR